MKWIFRFVVVALRWLIDLNEMSKTLYESMGPQKSIQLFEHTGADLSKFDATHHSPYGAYELAKCIIEGIRQNKLDLANHIPNDVPAFDPSKPDPVDQFDVHALLGGVDAGNPERADFAGFQRLGARSSGGARLPLLREHRRKRRNIRFC